MRFAMKSAIIESIAIAALLALSMHNAHAQTQQTEQQDTRHYPHTIEQLLVMHEGEVSVGPSATYWSEREMPLYIQDGCTEDIFHEKQACPF
jgi:hypothetical protein